MKISVVVPTYNEEKGLKKFLRQFNKQTMPRNEYEIIIVDGNSIDKTREIAEKYANTVVIQKSKGIGGARNDGVKIAKAEVIATTDADIILQPFWLEKIYKHFEKDKDLILLFGPQYLITKNKVLQLLSWLKRIMNQIFTSLHITYGAMGSNTAFRKKYFFKAGGYSSNLSLVDGFEITFRMRKLGKIRYDNNIFIYSSIRRIKKLGINKTVYILFINLLKFVLFGKKGVQVKGYEKQQY